MPIRAKICGLSTPDSIDAAVLGGAWAVGFVFFAKSPRKVAIDQVAALATHVPPGVRRVGVFVDPDDDLLARAILAGRLDMVQLHGDEPPQRASAIRARHGIEVLKAIPVKTRADLAAGAAYRGAADALLYDAKTPPGAELPGGMGLRFDWTLLAGHPHPLDWGLSGGLDAANVAEAARITGAPFVDVSSGVERAPGVKDMDKIAAFLQAVARS